MTWRRSAILGLAALAAVVASGPAAAQDAPAGLWGTWVRVGDPYRTKVRLHIGRTSLSAEVGCSVDSYPLVVGDRSFHAMGEGGLTMENPCHRCEGSGAAAYWSEVDYQIVASTTYTLVGDELTLVSPRGAMKFMRAYRRPGGGWVVPGDPTQEAVMAPPARDPADCEALPRRVIP